MLPKSNSYALYTILQNLCHELACGITKFFERGWETINNKGNPTQSEVFFLIVWVEPESTQPNPKWFGSDNGGYVFNLANPTHL